MKSKDELKEIDIKNRRCYYFGDIMRVIDIDFSDILLDKKSYENILFYFILFEKSGITCRINYNFPRIRIDSYNSLPCGTIFCGSIIICMKF